jgi:hypothetical protein
MKTKCTAFIIIIWLVHQNTQHHNWYLSQYSNCCQITRQWMSKLCVAKLNAHQYDLLLPDRTDGGLMQPNGWFAICCPEYGSIHLARKRKQQNEERHRPRCLWHSLFWCHISNNTASSPTMLVASLPDRPTLTGAQQNVTEFHVSRRMVFMHTISSGMRSFLHQTELWYIQHNS